MNRIDRLIDAYRRMDKRRKDEAIVRLERIALAHPEQKIGREGAASYLKLVVSRTLAGDAPEVDRGVHNFSSPVLVSCVVKR